MFKKTVDGVLAQFSKSVEDLRQIAQQQSAEAARLASKVIGLRVEQDAAVTEAERASRIAGNIEKLIA